MMKNKNEGISILIAMGTSLLVLALAFATLNSIARSLEQASNIQRTTQLFFASESGVESTFFNHNARETGLLFSGTDDSQTITHSRINATTTWTLIGRSTKLTDDSSNYPIYGGIMKENETIQIPLHWDTSLTPDNPVNNSGAPNYNSDHLSIFFFRDPEHICPLSIQMWKPNS